jgi:hypothetical protein
MKNTSQAICIWAGTAAFLVFLATPFFNGFLTPMSPNMDAADVVAFYQAHLVGIRIGDILLLCSPGLYIMFSAAITADMQKMEGVSPALPLLQVLISLFTVGPFVVVAMCWTTASFRLDRAPEITQALNDLGWFFYVMPGAPAVFQPITLGIGILCDKSRRPVYPRWVAYLNFIVAITYFQGNFVGLTKNGPFAWDGLISYYVPTVAFIVWIVTMTVLLLQNNKRFSGA